MRLIDIKTNLIACAIALICVSAMGSPKQIVATELQTDKEITIDFANSNKGSVIIFLSSVCPCSQSHMAHLQDLKNKYSDFNFVGVLSNSDENIDIAKKVFSGVNFTMLIDKQSKTADAFKALKTPHVFIVGPKYEILFQGGVTDVSNASTAKKFFLDEALSAIQKNEKPNIQVARALGCYIKRP